jgi:hypothetical protein
VDSDDAMLDIEVGDFVVLRLHPESSRDSVHYIGKVVRNEDGSYEIQCMRRHSATIITQFVFPKEDDTFMYDANEVMKRLSFPKIVRMVHHFLEEEICTVPNLR